jgi:hypothetical protein
MPTTPRKKVAAPRRVAAGKNERRLLTARQQFPAEIGGRQVVVIEGARFHEGHEVVRANPHMFEERKP